jgi:hypothetical protein
VAAECGAVSGEARLAAAGGSRSGAAVEGELVPDRVSWLERERERRELPTNLLQLYWGDVLDQVNLKGLT